MNETAPEEQAAVKFTTVATSISFARMVSELADDAEMRIRDWLDETYLQDVRERYAAMLDRKRAAISIELGNPIA